MRKNNGPVEQWGRALFLRRGRYAFKDTRHRIIEFCLAAAECRKCLDDKSPLSISNRAVLMSAGILHCDRVFLKKQSQISRPGTVLPRRRSPSLRRQ